MLDLAESFKTALTLEQRCEGGENLGEERVRQREQCCKSPGVGFVNMAAGEGAERIVVDNGG